MIPVRTISATASPTTSLPIYPNFLICWSLLPNSVFVYKGKAVDVKDVGHELGVRYVLEGSIQKIGGNVRINAQLIDATTNHHLWAERYDFALDNVFKVQDEITSTVVNSLQVILTEDEKNRGASRLTDVIEAYDLYLRGRTFLRGTKKNAFRSTQTFRQGDQTRPRIRGRLRRRSRLLIFPASSCR